MLGAQQSCMQTTQHIAALRVLMALLVVVDAALAFIPKTMLSWRKRLRLRGLIHQNLHAKVHTKMALHASARAPLDDEVLLLQHAARLDCLLSTSKSFSVNWLNLACVRS